MSFADLLDPLPIVSAFVGCVLGLLYFAVLRHTLVMLVQGRSRYAVISLTVLRLGAGSGLFFLFARLGVPALLATLAGFLSARMLALSAESRSG